MKTFFKNLILVGVIIFLATVVRIVIDGIKDDIESSDVIVVLGNKVEVSGESSPRLKSRLDKAVELYNQNLAPLIVVSGGIGKEGYDEAVVMKRHLMEQDIPEQAIIVDSNGVDSFHTAQNIKQIMDQQKLHSAFIVTNYYHIARTKLAFKKVGIKEVYSAHANYFELRDLYSITREVIGYYFYLIRKY